MGARLGSAIQIRTLVALVAVGSAAACSGDGQGGTTPGTLVLPVDGHVVLGVPRPGTASTLTVLAGGACVRGGGTVELTGAGLRGVTTSPGAGFTVTDVVAIQPHGDGLPGTSWRDLDRTPYRDHTTSIDATCDSRHPPFVVLELTLDGPADASFAADSVEVRYESEGEERTAELNLGVRIRPGAGRGTRS